MPDAGRRRVAVVVSELGFGGAERQTLDLLAQLRGTPWAPVGVISLSARTGTHADAVQALGYPLSVVPRMTGFDPRRILLLNRLLRRHEADLVHAINWFASGYAVLAKPRGARLISSIRNSHLPAGLLRRTVLPRLVRRADGVLVNSERGRRLVLEACGVPADRVTVVPNGLDVARLRAGAPAGTIRRELGIPAAAPVVLYVGRRARVKNIPRLLGVASALLEARADLRVVLAGDGLGPELVAGSPLAAESRLLCLGPRRDVPALLRDATLLLLTSDNEGMPNVVLEALASGVPVVATDVGDLARMLPERCGLLAPPAVAPLAAAVLRVVADAPGYRHAAALHAPAIVETYSSRAMASRTVELWSAVLPGAEQPSQIRFDEPVHRIAEHRVD
jgi:glycosyltransferase involved in cell wall biosynthesis